MNWGTTHKELYQSELLPIVVFIYVRIKKNDTINK